MNEIGMSRPLQQKFPLSPSDLNLYTEDFQERAEEVTLLGEASGKNASCSRAL